MLVCMHLSLTLSLIILSIFYLIHTIILSTNLHIVPGYPMVECERITCPPPYMGNEQPGAPPDPSLPAQDPFGTGGESYVIYG